MWQYLDKNFSQPSLPCNWLTETTFALTLDLNKNLTVKMVWHYLYHFALDNTFDRHIITSAALA